MAPAGGIRDPLGTCSSFRQKSFRMVLQKEKILQGQ